MNIQLLIISFMITSEIPEHPEWYNSWKQWHPLNGNGNILLVHRWPTRDFHLLLLLSVFPQASIFVDVVQLSSFSALLTIFLGIESLTVVIDLLSSALVIWLFHSLFLPRNLLISLFLILNLLVFPIIVIKLFITFMPSIFCCVSFTSGFGSMSERISFLSCRYLRNFRDQFVCFLTSLYMLSSIPEYYNFANCLGNCFAVLS